MSDKYLFIVPLKKPPRIPEKTVTMTYSRKAATEFIHSDLQYAEVPLSDYKSPKSLARALGRVLHGKRGLDKEGKIDVRSDGVKVYLIRK